MQQEPMLHIFRAKKKICYMHLELKKLYTQALTSIRETLNLSTDADSITIAKKKIVGRVQKENLWESLMFFGGKKN